MIQGVHRLASTLFMFVGPLVPIYTLAGVSAGHITTEKAVLYVAVTALLGLVLIVVGNPESDRI